MANQRMNNIVLGIFVISGAVVLVFALYMIGRNQSFFGSNYLVKTRFRNVSGLMPGNNVRFSGIQCGTVKSINIINDTTIEVALLINSQTSKYSRTNAQVSIGNDNGARYEIETAKGTMRIRKFAIEAAGGKLYITADYSQ